MASLPQHRAGWKCWETNIPWMALNQWQAFVYKYLSSLAPHVELWGRCFTSAPEFFQPQLLIDLAFLTTHHILSSFLSLSHFPFPLPMLPGLTFQINYLHLNPYVRVFFERILPSILALSWKIKENKIGISLPTGCLLSCKIYRPIIAQNEDISEESLIWAP